MYRAYIAHSLHPFHQLKATRHSATTLSRVGQRKRGMVCLCDQVAMTFPSTVTRRLPSVTTRYSRCVITMPRNKIVLSRVRGDITTVLQWRDACVTRLVSIVDWCEVVARCSGSTPSVGQCVTSRLRLLTFSKKTRLLNAKNEAARMKTAI